MEAKPVIAIMMGDPCGIGPEVVAKALASGEVHALCRPVVIGDTGAMAQAARLAGASVSVRAVAAVAGAGQNPGTIDVLDPGDLAPGAITIGQVSAACGRAVVGWTTRADELARSGQVQGVVLAPVNSEAIQLAGVVAAAAEPVPYLFLITGPLRVVHLTDHIPLREVCQEIDKAKLLALLELTHRSLRQWGIPRPRIGVAALNPHAAGVEDQTAIMPAVLEARGMDIDATGPVPADTIFRQCVAGQYDVVVAMYHDQGHIAVKTYRFEGTIAIHLGMPFLRLSVAHGTAFDIAGKGIADHAAILASIKTAATLAAGVGFPRS